MISYAPLSVRIIQAAFKAGGWKSKDDVMKLIPGPTVEEYQSSGGSRISQDKSIPSFKLKTDFFEAKNEKMKTLVFFVGGITYTEVAALRWMSQQEEQYGDIIVATTNFINGDSFFSNVF